jgi:PhoH-like ATPase
MKNTKIFVLDTNVLLYDPRAIFAFEDNEVVVPIYVIEEIDTFKKDLSELGRNARRVARYLDELRLEGDLTKGVPLNGGEGLLRVAITNKDLPQEYRLGGMTADNRILSTALSTQEKSHGRVTTFVTKDVNLRVRGHALGLRVDDFDTERTDISELYTGIAEVDVTQEQVDEFYHTGRLALPDPYYAPNQFVVLRDNTNLSHTALGKFNLALQCVEPLYDIKRGVWGIRPRNKEQHFALDALMNDTVRLVTLVGKAGTGKTLMALAAGLQKVTEEGVYQRMLISRPVLPLGRDIGYLPGSVEEKLNPWMQPIYDNVEFLMGLSRGERKPGRSYHELMDMGIIEIEPLTYIRGRSIPNQYMVVDEAQNLTPHEVKTILTRVGENTKIVLCGDPFQIDNPYVDSTNNGLVHTVNRFRSEKIAAHVMMTKGERSEMAELASNLL